MSGDYSLEIGGKRIFVNPMQITMRKSMELNEKITAARIANSAYSKLPPLENETKEAWSTRFETWAKEQDELKQGELASEFVKRAFDPVSYKDSINYMYDCVAAIASVFGQEDKASRDAFNDCSTIKANNFIARICQKAKVPCEFVYDDSALTPY